jgi:hypothetical protein
LIEDELHVLRSGQIVLGIRCSLQARYALAEGERAPDGIIAAGMLEKDGDIPPGTPVLPEKLRAGSIATQTVAEQDDRAQGRGVPLLRREINPDGEFTVPCGIPDGEVDRSW